MRTDDGGSLGRDAMWLSLPVVFPVIVVRARVGSCLYEQERSTLPRIWKGERKAGRGKK
jgi:hypothetical protein